MLSSKPLKIAIKNKQSMLSAQQWSSASGVGVGSRSAVVFMLNRLGPQKSHVEKYELIAVLSRK
jgi:hypothetical protein